MVGPPPPVTSTGDLFDVIASGEGGYESVNRGVLVILLVEQNL